MSQYPYQGQDPNQPQQQYGGYTPNQGSGQPQPQQPQQPYAENPYGQTPQQPYSQPQQPYGQQPFGQPPQQPPYGQTAYGQNPPPYGQTQPPYGQPQSPYGQPYGQQQVPYGQAAPLSLKTMHPGYLTALIGGAVAFIAFFLPYYGWSYSSTYLGTHSASVNGSTVASVYAQFWLEFLLALAAIAVALLLQFGTRWFANFQSQPASFMGKVVTSLTTKTRNWVIALIGIGGAGVLLHLLFMLTSLSNIGGTDIGGTGYSAGWGFGAWLYLLAMLAVAVGGFLAFRPDMLARITKR